MPSEMFKGVTGISLCFKRVSEIPPHRPQTALTTECQSGLDSIMS